MINGIQKLSAVAGIVLILALAGCGGGSSSSGISGGATSGGQTSTIIVSSSSLAHRQVEGLTLIAQAISDFLIRNAEAVIAQVTISGEEFGTEGRVFTPDSDGVVYIPVFGGSYTICIEATNLPPESTCELVPVGMDSVVVVSQVEGGVPSVVPFPADADEVADAEVFVVPGQEHKRMICHKGKKTIRVASQAVYNGHMKHNDTAGACPVANNGQPPVNDDESVDDDISEVSEDNGSDGQGKVNVCHNGKTLSVSASSLGGHLGHGDSQGTCRSPT